MPVLEDFGGFKITMYFDDHNPPHFHTLGPDWRATFVISSGALLKGRCPKAAERILRKWAEENAALCWLN